MAPNRLTRRARRSGYTVEPSSSLSHTSTKDIRMCPGGSETNLLYDPPHSPPKLSTSSSRGRARSLALLIADPGIASSRGPTLENDGRHQQLSSLSPIPSSPPEATLEVDTSATEEYAQFENAWETIPLRSPSPQQSTSTTDLQDTVPPPSPMDIQTEVPASETAVSDDIASDQPMSTSPPLESLDTNMIVDSEMSQSSDQSLDSDKTVQQAPLNTHS